MASRSWLAASLWLFLACSSTPAQTTRYDAELTRWAHFYFPFEDWRWFKAQGIAESGLNPLAKSPCGARGIMQLMPATAREMGVADASDPESNIRGGVRYDRALWRAWSSIADPSERRRFMFGSYNAGLGNIRKASRGPSWSDAVARLAAVTGKLAQQTIDYVMRIWRFYDALG